MQIQDAKMDKCNVYSVLEVATYYEEAGKEK